MPSRAMDISNQKFGRWTALKEVPERGNRSEIFWECICDCGAKRRVRSSELKRGHSKGCGCQKIPPDRTTHGCTKTPEYTTWKGMMRRCTCSTDKDYKNYGGRGIKVCERWESFENFLADMGLKPSLRHSIERTKNEGNYDPDNCCWALPDQQARNRRNTKLTVDMVSEIRLSSSFLSQIEIAEKFGIAPSHVWRILASQCWL